MPEGLADSFAEAIAAAEAELGTAEPSAPEQTPDSSSPDEPEELFAEASDPTDDAEAEATEQPADAEAEAEEELFTEEDVDEPDDEAPTLDDSTEFTLPGIDQPVTLQELKDGYLRQSDYTKKTQEVAAQRKEADDAVAFWSALQERPVEMVKALAAKIGMPVEGIDESAVEMSPFKTAAEVEAEIERRVEEAVQEHPSVAEARVAEARRVIESEFNRIESEYEVTLGPKSRDVILAKAQETGATDLEMVFNALMAQRERRAANRSNLKKAAPSTPTARTGDVPTPPKEINSIADAALAAEAELAEV